MPTVNIPRLRIGTLFSTVMGGSWLLIEYFLQDSSVELNPYWSVILIFGLAGALYGLPIRPRETLRGDIKAISEVPLVIIFATSLVPALMFILYSAGLVISTLSSLVLWGVWGIGFIIVWALQIAIWAGIFAGVIISIQSEDATVFASIFAVTILLTILGWTATGNFFAVWDATVPKEYAKCAYDLPQILYLMVPIRKICLSLQFNYICNTALTNVLGVSAAVASAMIVRGLRMELMNRQNWRPYIPMATAPERDEKSTIERELVLPSVSYAILCWILFLSLAAS